MVRLTPSYFRIAALAALAAAALLPAPSRPDGAALARPGPSGSAEADRLIRQLGSDDFEEREAASKALLDLGNANLPALRRAASSQDPEIARRAGRLVDVLDPVPRLRQLGAEVELTKEKEGGEPVITGLGFHGEAGADCLADLRPFDRLDGLTIHGGVLTDECMDRLANLKSLRHLNLMETTATDAALARLKRLKNLDSLALVHSDVTDKGLSQLKKFSHLVTLNLSSNDHITDAGVACLKGIDLDYLNLAYTNVTDAAMEDVASLRNLKMLMLFGTKITDAGLPPLKRLTKLNFVFLPKPPVTAKAEAELMKGLPNLIH